MIEAYNMNAVMPELFLLSVACVVLILNLFLSENQKIWSYFVSQLGLVGAGFLTWALYHEQTVITFSNHMIVDKLACLLKLFIYLSSFIAFLYSRDYVFDREMPKGETYVLGLFSVLGMSVLVSANSFITLYLGMELLSLPLYALVAIRRDNGLAAEAGMKYFIMGAIASGMLLYGMSLLYGVSGTLILPELANSLAALPSSQMIVMLFALVFIVVGVAFKFGAVPFHMWLPDVYHGAPSSVTLFLSAAPKLAAIGMLFRLLHDGMGNFHADWQQLLIVMAILSIFLGNIAAVIQTNLKRLFAYSAIAHVGYGFLGLIAGTPEGYSVSLFYFLSYALMSLCAFGMIVILSKKGFEAENIEDFKGLNARSPWLAFMMLIVLFSLAGVPPTVGFVAKFFVLMSLVHVNMISLAVFAVLMAVVGCYYYLRVVQVMYFSAPEDTSDIVLATDVRFTMALNGGVLLLLGLFPSTLIQACLSIFS